MLMTTPTTVDAAPTGAELSLCATADVTPAPFVSTLGARVALVHVPPVPLPEDVALLSETERARAMRFVFERDRSAFVTARAALRRTLGTALSCAPQDVRLVIDASGRPALDTSHSASLDFNLSHSGSVAAIALTAAGRVGVDIEAHDPRRGLRELVPTVMGRGERARLEAVRNDTVFANLFHEYWTRKEALVKGMGTGLATDVRTIDVPLLPPDGVVVLNALRPSRWRLVTTRVSEGVTLSVALAAPALRDGGTITIQPFGERAG
jgi:4'-phosphopantetheinyl transferase